MGDVDERVIFCSSNVAGSSTCHIAILQLGPFPGVAGGFASVPVQIEFLNSAFG
jgi:hypothetical protein